MFYLGEYVSTVTVAAVGVTLFLGGWRGYWPFDGAVAWSARCCGSSLKVTAVIYVLILVRATLPRMRYDRLMSFGWKVLIPFGLVWVMVTGVVVVLPQEYGNRGRYIAAAVIVGRRGARDARRPACSRAGRLPSTRRCTREATTMPWATRTDRRWAVVTIRDPAAPAASKAHGTPRVAIGKGMATVFKQTFRPDNTEQYPKEIAPIPERSHIGRHLLNTHEDGLEKCIGCELCAFACPADAIWVEGADNDPEASREPGGAVREGLPDQLPALHHVRPLRRGLPDPRAHAHELLRDGVHEPRGSDLDEGAAARAAAAARHRSGGPGGLVRRAARQRRVLGLRADLGRDRRSA